ncbi:MAG: DedA family protein [Candidatus Kaiserbacteria bacterium]|nr:DedA family protein [Candidatus Kaiserbacteria bacterium]
MLGFLPALLAFLEQSKYVLVFIGCYFEGSAAMMTTGFLWHLGVVSFWPAFGTLLAADFCSDIMWYLIGRCAARSFFMRWGHFMRVTPQIIEKVEKRFNRYHAKILVVSKLTMGFGFAVPILIVAGMLRVPFLRYVTINVLGGVVWISLLMCVGYYFGNILQYIPGNFQIALALMIPVLFFFGIRTVSRKLATIDW